ncbi:MAG: long-chain fatty acid--CoA ligase [Myxococcota bacterium]
MPDLWHHRVGSTPDTEALRFKVDGRWRSMTWGEAGARVRAIASGLLAQGVAREQRCVILAGTSVEWILSDLAVLCAGAATTTIYPQASDAEVAFILADSEAVVAFVDGPEQVERVVQLRAELPALRRVVTFQGAGSADGFVIGLGELERRGRAFAAEQPEAYVRAHRSVTPSQLATLMYTSGTTGRPKGVMLTHDAWVYEAEAIDALGFMHPADVQLLWLPLAHVFAKVLELSVIRLGIPTVVDGSAEALVDNLHETRPTWFAGVPRTFEKARERLLAEAERADPVRRRLFAWALAVGMRRSALRRVGRSPSLSLRAKHAVAERMVFRQIREKFGGRLRFMISGGAPLPIEVAEFFDAMGVRVLEGYGLTESAAASCVNRLDDFRFGTVGPPLPGCEVKIAADGEVLLRSRGVMRGYWRLPDDTAEVLGEDRFLRTGDVGKLLPSGHLQITGRKKELIVTAGGKNVAPSQFESQLRTRCPYVSQALLHGDRRPYCVALITLDPERAIRWAHDNDVAFADFGELSGRHELHELIQGYVDAVNRGLPSYENVRRFAILPADFTLESGLLTPSLKVKRREVEARYRTVLDGLYDPTRARRTG